MVFFASRHRVKGLPLHKRLWMTPVAYILKYMAGGVMVLADKFDEKVTFDIITNTKGDVE
ncbi:hypothetical protein [Pseudobacillus badius]|uniref:hypothetical protein n=1 Tax=Bacillus badius TaxID=1455 RepID=UPI0007B3EA5B|nr:hypothetical protein [Bacillus badius]KZR57537.1 hypothetical protein A3781_19795 [Bacillus badius]